MRSGRRALAAWTGGILLAVLHVDFWREQTTRLWLGWLPEEALYRLAWMILAWLYLLWFCSAVWREER